MANNLIRYEAMRHAVAACHTVDEAKAITDKAVAMMAYARQIHDREMWDWCAEIKLRAQRRYGEMDELRSPPGRGHKIVTTGNDLSRVDRLRCRQLASLDEPAFEQLLIDVKESTEELTTRAVLNVINRREAQATLVEGDGLPPEAPGKEHIDPHSVEFRAKEWLVFNRSAGCPYDFEGKDKELLRQTIERLS